MPSNVGPFAAGKGMQVGLRLTNLNEKLDIREVSRCLSESASLRANVEINYA